MGVDGKPRQLLTLNHGPVERARSLFKARPRSSEDSRAPPKQCMHALDDRRVWSRACAGRFVVSWRRLSCTARPQLCLEPCCKGDQLDNSQSQKSSILAIPFHAGGSLKLLGEKPQLAFFRETELLIEFRDSRYRAPLRSLFGVPQQLTSTVQLSLSFSLPLSTRQATLERITAATAIAACGKPSTPHPEKSKRQQ